MAYLPRIIVVDSQHQLGQTMRAILSLVNRPAVVIEAPSGEAALLEMRRAPADMLVCASRLSSMSGFEVATRACEMRPGLNAIVIADAGEIPAHASRAQTPFTVLVRPLTADQLTRALLGGLGIQVHEPAPPPPSPASDLGPVPTVDLEELRGIMSALLTDVGAMAIVLIDREGRLLLEHGAVGYLDREELTRVLAPSFAVMGHVGGVVGGDPWGIYFWDGERFDIYGLSLGLHHFVCLVFEGSAGQRALGSVMLYGRRAVEEMLKVVGAVAFQTAISPSPRARERRPAAGERARAATPEKARAPSAPPAPRTPSPAPPPSTSPPAAEAEPEAPALPVSKVDAAAIEQALGQLQNVDADAFWDVALQDGARQPPDAASGDALTFEEALQMGLVPPELGQE